MDGTTIAEANEADLAARGLHGALTRRDAERLIGADELARAVRDGAWCEPWTGVVVPERRAQDPRTRAAAALLRTGPHSVLSGTTAAAMHGCAAATDPVLHVTVPYDRELRSMPGLAVHNAWIRERDVVELDGLRCQALDVALCDLLCTGPRRTALACLEQSLQNFADHAEQLRALVSRRLAERCDRRGTRRGADLLALAWSAPIGAEAA